MAGNTPRGYPTFDPTGADQGLNASEYFNALTSVSDTSFVNRLDTEQTEQDDKIEVLEEAIDNIDTSVVDLEGDITELEGVVAQHGVAIGEIEEQLAEHESTIASMLLDITEADAELGEHADAISQLEIDVIGLSEDMIDAQEAIEGKASVVHEHISVDITDLADTTVSYTGVEIAGLPENPTVKDALEKANQTAQAALNLTDADIPYTGVVIPDATTMQEAVELAYNHGSGGNMRINTIRITSGKGHVVIPPGVRSISATLVSGGEGGTAGGSSNSSGAGGIGGGVKHVLDIPVEEGQSYYYEIGEGGKSGAYGSADTVRYGGDTVFGQYRVTNAESDGNPAALLDDENNGIVAGNGQDGIKVFNAAFEPFIQPIGGGGAGGTNAANATTEYPRAGFAGVDGTGGGGGGGGAPIGSTYTAAKGGDGGSGVLLIQFNQAEVEPNLVHVLETYTESGIYTVPDDCTEVDIFIASGADGGTDGAIGIDGEPGLGGAVSVVRNYKVTPGDEIPVLIGVGGTRGVNGSSRASRMGGTSSFGNINVTPDLGSTAPIHLFRDSNYPLYCGMGGVANPGGDIMPEGGGGLGATMINNASVPQQNGRDGIFGTAGGGGAGCASPTGSSYVSKGGNGSGGIVVIRRSTRVYGSGGNLAGLTVDVPNYVDIDNITIRTGSIDTTRRMAVEE